MGKYENSYVVCKNWSESGKNFFLMLSIKNCHICRDKNEMKTSKEKINFVNDIMNIQDIQILLPVDIVITQQVTLSRLSKKLLKMKKILYQFYDLSSKYDEKLKIAQKVDYHSDMLV